MYHLYFRLFCILLFSTICTPTQADTLEETLDSLDKAIEERHVYAERRNEDIKRVKTQIIPEKLNSQNSMIYQQLYFYYYKLNPDSATYYAQLINQIGIKYHHKGEIELGKILENVIYVLRAVHPVSESNINLLPRIEDLENGNKGYYANMMLDNQIGLTRIKDKNIKINTQDLEAWEKYKEYLVPGTPMAIYYEISLNKNVAKDKMQQTLIKTMQRVNNNPLDMGLLEFSYYQLLNEQNKQDEALYHLIKSAIWDIKAVNHETESLLLVVEYLYKHNPCLDEKKFSRLLNYINLCSENAILYQDNGRSYRIVKLQNAIFEKYENFANARLMQQTILKWGFLVFFLMVVILSVILYRRNKKLSQIVAYSQNNNERLSSHLQETTEKADAILSDVNRFAEDLRTHDKTIVEIFLAMSQCINDMKLHKKAISNLLNTNLFAEAKKLASSNSIIDQEANLLYQQFDRAFLTIHPDFVERFNQLMQVDKRFKPKDSLTLTPELRIYGLVCLGMNDSTKISEILHYSSQTVYNYRLKTRQAAIIPKKEFAQAVMDLYSQKILGDTISLQEK